MTIIQLENVNIKFEREYIIQKLSLQFASEKNSVLLGLSGSGKTTILRAIAGIGSIDSGRILFDGKDVTNAAPYKRNIGYIPQKQLLFPGLSVSQNIAYGLHTKKQSKIQRQKRVEEIATLLGIRHMLDRSTVNLSGGEAQKVALARALAPEPQVLLFDEPFSALDTGERMKMVLQLKETLENLPVTTIYVTHSPQEAEILADEIFILEEGRIIQHGQFLLIKHNPESFHVAALLGLPNIFTEIPPALQIIKEVQQYRKGRYYYIPPDHIKESARGQFTGKVLAHFGEQTVVKIEGVQLVMKRINTGVSQNIKLEIGINQDY